jgi:hypothetical protein
MNNNLDPETLKIPAYMRKKAIVSQARQKLILTALDRKDAGLSPHSQKALAPMKSTAATSRIGRLQKTAQAGLIRPVGPKINFARTSRLGRNLFPQSVEDDTQLSIPSFSPATFTSPISVPKDKSFPLIGKVTDYLDRIGVAIILLSAPLKENESVLIQGEENLFTQTVEEMQIDRKPVAKAKKGAHIGLKVSRPAQAGGAVYRLN